MADKTTFHPYGVSIPGANGDVVLNAGANMTIFPSGNLITFAAQIPPNVSSLNGIMGAADLVAGDGIAIGITGNKITFQTGNAYVSEGGFDFYVTEDGLSTYVTES